VVFRQGTSAGACALALLISLTSPAEAQSRADCERAYTPQRAQEGKDVVWMPTEDSMLGPMFELARVTAADTLYDLGSGDGRIVIAAAKRFGATAVGIEYDADLVGHARCLAAAEGVADRVTFVQGDIFENDFRDATVVAIYLTPQVNLRLLPVLLKLTPGTRIVAYSFGLGDWEPDAQVDSFGDGSVFFYVVPADVRGSWAFRPHDRGGAAFDVELEQTFQMLAGSAGGAALTGKLAGNAIEFSFTQGGRRTRVTGSVDGDRIEAAVVRDGVSARYVATRR
jgi:SAM-dependent methyltransferase